MGQICPVAIFANKTLLKHVHTHLFRDCLELLSPYDGRDRQLQQRLCSLQNLKYLLFCPLQKSLLIPALGDQNNKINQCL